MPFLLLVATLLTNQEVVSPPCETRFCTIAVKRETYGLGSRQAAFLYASYPRSNLAR